MKNLFSGKCSLWFTFWIGYGLPVYIFLTALDAASGTPGNVSPAYIIALIALCYVTAMTTAVWKSADLYAGPGIWKLVAKVSVVFFDMELLAELGKFF
jgi:hypothetical protein